MRQEEASQGNFDPRVAQELYNVIKKLCDETKKINPKKIKIKKRIFPDEVKKLLNNSELDINWQELVSRHTFLMMACESAFFNPEIVEMILKFPGIDLSLKYLDGRTAYSYAMHCFWDKNITFHRVKETIKQQGIPIDTLEPVEKRLRLAI
jgi:hypothetical protein